MSNLPTFNVSDALAYYGTNSTAGPVIINDSSNNILANLDALQLHATKIKSINQTDVATLLDIKMATFNKNKVIMTKWSGSYYLSVSDIPASKINAVLKNTHVTALSITDSVTNLKKAINLNKLLKLGDLLTDIKATGSVTKLPMSASNYSATFTSKLSNLTAHVNDVPKTLLGTLLADPKVSSFSLKDTANNIASLLDSLQLLDTKLTEITKTDIKPIPITVAQLLSDQTTLNKIINTYTLKVSGVTPENITSVLSDKHVTDISITLSTQDILNSTNLLNTKVNHITEIIVKDTSTNIVNNIDILKKLGVTLVSIIQTDPANPLNIPTSPTNNNAALIAKITTDYSLSATKATVADTVNILNDATTHNAKNIDINILDSTININTKIDLLETYTNSIFITLKNIKFTDDSSVLNLSSQQFFNDTDVLNLITSPYSLTLNNINAIDVTSVLINSHVTNIAVLDTAASIADNISVLTINASVISSATIININQPIDLSINEFLASTPILNKIKGLYKLTINDASTTDIADISGNTHVSLLTIKDTTANILNNLNALLALGAKLSDITQLDPKSPIELSNTQFVKYAGILNNIVTPYLLKLTDVPIIKIISVLSNPAVSSISVLDSSTNIVSKLDTLGFYIDQISAIRLTNAITPTPALNITFDQFFLNSDVFNKITNAFLLNLSNVDTTDLNSVLSNPHLNSISVSDTADNIGASFETLNANLAKITSIVVTDLSTPISLTANQLNANIAVLNHLGKSTSLAIIEAPASFTTNANVAYISVVDSSENITTNLHKLKLLGDKVTDISQTNSLTPMTLTLSQYNTDAVVLNKLQTSYSLIINDVTISNLKSNNPITNDPSLQSITITDTVNSIKLALDLLSNFVGSISKINIKDTSTPVIALTVDQLNNDRDVLNLITNTNQSTLFNVDLGISKSLVSLDGSNGHINFILHPNSTGIPSEINFDVISTFKDQDKISFATTVSKPLNISSSSSNVATGLAQLDAISGIANFNDTDNTLSLQITAAEKAITTGAGNIALWQSGTDSYVFISDTTAGVTAGDNLIQLTGVDVSHLHLVNGAISYV